MDTRIRLAYFDFNSKSNVFGPGSTFRVNSLDLLYRAGSGSLNPGLR